MEVDYFFQPLQWFNFIKAYILAAKQVDIIIIINIIIIIIIIKDINKVLIIMDIIIVAIE
jgi:hypothetical protein